jgi:hypothetical protein
MSMVGRPPAPVLLRSATRRPGGLPSGRDQPGQEDVAVRVALDQEPRPAELHARHGDPLRPVDVDPRGVDTPHRDHGAVAIAQPESLEARLAGDLNGRGLQPDLHGEVAAHLARHPPVDRQYD